MQGAPQSVITKRPKTKEPYIYESISSLCFLSGPQLIRLTIFCQDPRNNQQLSSFIVYINTGQPQNTHLKSIVERYKQKFNIAKNNIDVRLFKANKNGKKISGVIRAEMIEMIFKYREKPFYFVEEVEVQLQWIPTLTNESSQFSFIEFQNLTFKQTIVQIEYDVFGKTQQLQKSQFLFGQKQSILQVKNFFFNEFKKENLAFYFWKNNEDFYTEEQLKKSNIGMLMNEENVVKILIRVQKKVKQRKSKLQNSAQLSLNSQYLDNISKSRQSISSGSLNLQSYQENTPELTDPETLIPYQKKIINLSLKIFQSHRQEYIIEYQKYKDTTLNEYIQQFFSQDQIHNCPKNFTGIIFDKKAYFRQTITFKNILKLYFKDANKFEESENKQINIQITIYGNPRLFEVIKNLQNPQKKVKKRLFKTSQFIRRIQDLKKNESISSEQKQNLLFEYISQAQANLQNYRGETRKNAQNKVFFTITEQQFYSDENIKNIKQNDVITFPYFITASKNNYDELPEKILHRSVVFEISTISGKKLQLKQQKSHLILLLPFTNYLITDIKKAKRGEYTQYTYIHMRQMPFPLENRILFWVDDKIENNFFEIRTIQKHPHPTYDVITFQTEDQFLLWMKMFYEIIQTFDYKKEMKLIQDNLRYQKDKNKDKIPKYCALSLIQKLEKAFPQISIPKKLPFRVYIDEKVKYDESPEQEAFKKSKYNSQIVCSPEQIQFFLDLPQFYQYWQGQKEQD